MLFFNIFGIRVLVVEVKNLDIIKKYEIVKIAKEFNI
jgi:hypothetical protein